jgi:nucleoside-diphosphate-sugar epimerase
LENIIKPRILIIGGTGFIGHHLIKALVIKDFSITSISLNQPTKQRFVEGVKYHFVDINVPNSCSDILNNNFHYVVNLGGYIDHSLFKDDGRDLIVSHFNALQNIIAALPRDELMRFVQIGSSDEYGNSDSPQHETLRELPISPYSLGKVASTHFLQMLYRTEKFPSVILRLFLTYGPGQAQGRFLPQIIRACLDNENFPVSAGEQLRDFCYIDDTVDAIIKALFAKNINGHVINIASGKPITIKNIIKQVHTIISKGSPVFGSVPYRVGENMSLYANINKSKKLLDWEPRVLIEDGLKKTIDSFINERE